MTPQRKRQLQRRIARVRDRLTRNEARLEALHEADSHDFRGPLKKIAEEAIKAGKLTDKDNDGDVEFDDLVDTVVAWLDEKIAPNNPIAEWASDVGFDIVAHVAVAIYQNTEKRIERRVNRLRELLASLETKLKAG